MVGYMDRSPQLIEWLALAAICIILLVVAVFASSLGRRKQVAHLRRHKSILKRRLPRYFAIHTSTAVRLDCADRNQQPDSRILQILRKRLKIIASAVRRVKKELTGVNSRLNQALFGVSEEPSRRRGDGESFHSNEPGAVIPTIDATNASTAPSLFPFNIVSPWMICVLVHWSLAWLATHEGLYQMLCEHSDITAACVLFLLATTSFNSWKSNYRSKARTDRRQVLVQSDKSKRPASVMMHEEMGSPPRNPFTNNTITERAVCTLQAVEDELRAKAATATALEQRCSRLQLELGAARGEIASEVSSAVTATNERWLRFRRAERNRTTTAVSWLRWVLAKKRVGAAAVQAEAKHALQAASTATMAAEKRAGIVCRDLQAEGKTCATLRNCLAKSRQKEARAFEDSRKKALENARLMASLRNERARHDYALKHQCETDSAVMTGLRNGLKEHRELLARAEQAAARQAKSSDDLRARVDQLARELVASQADAHTSREQASKEILAVQSSAVAESERAAAVIIALREEAVTSNAAASEAAAELRAAVAAASDERDAAIAARDDARSTAEEPSRAVRGCQEDLVRARNDAASTAANGPQGIDDDTDDTKGAKRCREACDGDHDVRDDFDDDDDDTTEDATSEDDDQTENNATPSNGLAHAKKPRRRSDDASAVPSLTYYGELHALTRASPIVSFFLGGADRKGRYVNQLIAMTDESLEAGHDYIQYIFPTTERSRFARDAPVVNDDDMLALFAHQRPVQETMLRCFCRMLEFYGLELFEGGGDGSVEVEKGANFNPHARWMTYHGDTPDHNALRLTRILTSLRLFSLERHADALKFCLLQSLPQLSRHPSRAYWEGA